MSEAPQYFTLNDGNRIPSVGFCVYAIPTDGMTYKAVRTALEIGYRHIDTAASYFNESEVGQAIRDSGLPREEIFVTTKLQLEDYGYATARKGLERSLEKLGLDYVDLYSLNHPCGDVLGSWKAMEEARRDGLIRSLGVCNMTPRLWKKHIDDVEIPPAVVATECSPYNQQHDLRELFAVHGTLLLAAFPNGPWNAELVREPFIKALAKKYGKTPDQIILGRALQEGLAILPRIPTQKRIRENLDIFDFVLTPEEAAEFRALDRNEEMLYDPDEQNDDLERRLVHAYDIAHFSPEDDAPKEDISETAAYDEIDQS